MKHYQYGTVNTAIEVSFVVDGGQKDYGTIFVPVGTEVERFVEKGDASPWFVRFPAKVCPKSFLINGKPSSSFIHDATYRGIIIPNANVKNG